MYQLNEPLKEYWKADEFLPLQKEICNAVIEGVDCIALLPTGGGKSLCYQLPATQLKGSTLVISPLISLMEDQIAQANSRGIKSMFFNSKQPFEKQLDNAAYGNYKLIYSSPEKLLNPLFIQQIHRLNIDRIAVDEAHCISQWGNDFRPAYKEIKKLRKQLPQVPVIALTASATKTVVKDIIRELELKDYLLFKNSFKRKNIELNVQFCTDKFGELIRSHLPLNQPSIIYCNSRRETEEIYSILKSNSAKVNFYHGGLTDLEKKDRLDDWQAEKSLIMVATNAFGMGIDKGNVALVSHLHMPSSLEHYYQEIGRAGRNGNEAKAILLVHPNDHKRVKSQFIDSLVDKEFMNRCYKHLCNYLNIAYGEGKDQSWFLSFSDFCSTYSLPPRKTDNCLTLFHQAGIFHRQNFSQQEARIQLTCTPASLLYNIEKTDREAAEIFEYISRKYPTIFDNKISVDLDGLALQTNLTFRVIIERLKQWQKLELISFDFALNDTSLIGLVPREDNYTLLNLGKQINQLNTIKKEKLQIVIDYSNNTKNCKQKQLLEYFGESVTGNCGKCSSITCTQTEDQNETTTIELEILTLLDDSPLSLQQLKIKLPHINKDNLIKGLDVLFLEKKIDKNTLDQIYKL